MPDTEEFLDEELHKVANMIDTTRISPTNADHIKRTYTKGMPEPEFNYHEAPDFSEVQERLKKLRFPKTVMGELLREKKKYLLQKTSLISAIGTPEFTALSKKIHPLPKQALIRKAKEILSQKPVENADKVALMDAYRDLQQTLDTLGMPWRVQKINMVASASVLPSQRLLYLKRKMLFSRRFIERLKIHEIGTHAVRAENGRLQPFKIFLHGFAQYLPTEEGLAVYNEEKFGLLDATVFRTYAGRTLAVFLAQKHTFTEVVEALQEYMPEKQAIVLALRAKRGVAHGRDMGGYTKDTAYLRGYFAIKEFEEAGGDVRQLYYGKIGIQHVPLLKKIKGLVPPKYFPEMLNG